MASKAYKVFSNNMETVNRLLDTYEKMKDVLNPEHKRGRVALDHITRAAIVFMVSAFEVYIEDILNETVRIHIEYAHNFINLPYAVQDMLHKEPNKYPNEKWIQKYRRLVKKDTANLNTPKIYKIKELFLKYLAIGDLNIDTLSHCGDIDSIIIKRGKIVHTVKAAQYVNKKRAEQYKKDICDFVKCMDNFLVQNIKNTYPQCRMPWNIIS